MNKLFFFVSIYFSLFVLKLASQIKGDEGCRNYFNGFYKLLIQHFIKLSFCKSN